MKFKQIQTNKFNIRSLPDRRPRRTCSAQGGFAALRLLIMLGLSIITTSGFLACQIWDAQPVKTKAQIAQNLESLGQMLLPNKAETLSGIEKISYLNKKLSEKPRNVTAQTKQSKSEVLAASVVLSKIQTYATVDLDVISEAVKQQLDLYLKQGLFKGEKGDKGDPGQNSNATVNQTGNSTTIAVGGIPMVSYYQPNPSQSFSGGSLAGFTTLSTDSFTAKNINVSGSSVFSGNLTLSGSVVIGTGGDLNVSGSATLATTTITNLTVTNLNPQFVQGSLVFQGESGLAQDGSYLYYDAATHRLALGTTTPSGVFTLKQTSNNTTLLYAQRNTDVAPSGDFIEYYNAAGDTALFRVDNSGNIYAGGIQNSGSLTVTSLSEPQFRVQYDSSNEWTASTNSSGITTFAFNGSTPKAAWIPASNSINTFSFSNASSTSILSIDTLNGRVGVGTNNPTGAFQVQSGQVSFGGEPSGSLWRTTIRGDYSWTALDANGTATFELYSGSKVMRLLGGTRLEGYVQDLVLGTDTNTNSVTIQRTTGYVGIGTAVPRRSLGIDGTGIDVMFPFQSTSRALSFGQSGTAGWEGAGIDFINKQANYGGGLSLNYHPANNLNSTNLVQGLVLNWYGNVGIGSTSPNSMLTVQGTSSTSSLLNIASSTGASLLYVANNGNVGIGTTSPSQLLTVGNNNQFTVTSAGAVTAAGIITSSFSNSGRIQLPNIDRSIFGNSTGEMDYYATYGFHKFMDQSSNLGTIIAGNVGIGTTNPNVSLQVVGQAKIGTYAATSETGDLGISRNSASSTGYIYFGNNLGTYIGFNGGFQMVGSGEGTIQGSRLKINNKENNAYALQIQRSDYAGSSGYFLGSSASTTPDLIFSNTAGNEKVRITNAGSVGIGTTSPGSQLNVYRSAYSATSQLLLDTNDTTTQYNTAFKIQRAGNQVLAIRDYYSSGNFYSDIAAGTGKWLRIYGNDSYGTDGRIDLNATSIFLNGTVYPQGNIMLTRLGDATSVATQQGTYQLLMQNSLWNGSTNVGRTNSIRSIASTVTQGLDRIAFLTQDVNGTETEQVSMLNNGNVGIGIVNPAASLHVIRNNAVTNIANINDVNTRSAFLVHGFTGSTRQLGIGDNSHGMVVQGVTTENASVDLLLNPFGGNVGIGTTSPQTTLSVQTPGTAVNETALTLSNPNTSAYSTTGIIFNAGGKPVFKLEGQEYSTLNYGMFIFSGANSSGVMTERWRVDQLGNLVLNGTTLYGSSAASANLTLDSTSNGTKGNVIITPTNGNVGIGTTTPAALLHTYVGTGVNNLYVNSGAVRAQIQAYDGAGGSVTMGSYSNHPLQLITGTAPRIYIDTTGNVGIGTTGPGSKLAIHSDTQAKEALKTWNNSNMTELELYRARGAESGSASVSAGSDLSRILFTVHGNANTNQEYAAIKVKENNSGGDIYFQNSTASGSLQDRMVISNTGNIGIGTTSPGTTLEVYGASPFTGTSYSASTRNLGNLTITTSDAQGQDIGGILALGGNRGSTGYGVFGGIRGAKENSTDGNNNGYLGLYTSQSGVAFAERMRITSAGNVGIGTIAPGSLLHIQGDPSSAILTLQRKTTAGDLPIYFTKTSGGLQGAIVSYNAGDLSFHTTDGSEKMRILNNGNVGIGTTTPQAQFSLVNSTASNNVLNIQGATSQSGAYIYATPASGNGFFIVSSTFGLELRNSVNTGIYLDTANHLIRSTNNVGLILGSSSGTSGDNISALYMKSDAVMNFNGDVGLSRYAPGIIAVGNGIQGNATGTMIAGAVGIGTTSPAVPLHVVGNARIGGNLALYDGGDGNSVTVFKIGAGPQVGGGYNQTANFYPSRETSLTGHNNDIKIVAYDTFRFYQSAGGGVPGYQVFHINANSYNEQIAGLGRVGIGTTNPLGWLHVLTDRSTTTPTLILQASSTQAAALTQWRNSAGSVLSVVDVSGSFGIGTTSPNYPLVIQNNAGNAFVVMNNQNAGVGGGYSGFRFQINGNDRYTAALDASGNQIYSRFNSSGSFLNNPLTLGNTGDITFTQANGTASMYLSTTGNVGIGTTEPFYRLDVQRSAGSDIISNFEQTTTGWASILRVGAVANNTAGIAFYGDTSQVGKIQTVGTSGMSFHYGSSATEAMRITSTGNVGIGTTSPATLLSISGTAQNGLTVTSSNVNGSGIVLGSTSVGGHNMQFFSTGSGNTPGHFGVYDLTASQFLYSVSTAGFKLPSGSVYAWSSNSGSDVPGGAADTGLSRGAANKIYVGNGTAGDYTGTLIAGNVGIGTTSPSQKLDVWGNLNVATGTTPALFVNTATGNVGVGTNNPGYILNVQGAYSNAPFAITASDGSPMLTYTNGVNYTAGTLNFNGGRFTLANNGSDVVFNTNRNDYQFQFSGTSAMYINNTGNVGIGTTSPTAKLDVQGVTGLISQVKDTTLGTNYNFTTDSSGRAFLNVTGQPGAGSAAGAYFNATGYQEAWFTVTALGNSVGQKVMRFGNGSNGCTNCFAIQSLNDEGTAISATPFILNNNAPSNSMNIYSSGEVGLIRGLSIGSTYYNAATPSNGVIIQGNVGIGTTSPLTGLQIQKSATVYGIPNVGLIIGESANGTGGLVGGYNPTGNYGFVTAWDSIAGGRNLVLQPYGGTTRVAIGTTSPQAMLHVYDSNSGQGMAVDTAANQDVWYYVKQANANKGAFGYRNSTNALTIWDGSTDLIAIKSSNVGIGSTGPLEKLDIGTTVLDSVTGSSNIRFTYTNNPGAYYNSITNIISATQTNQKMQFNLTYASSSVTPLTLVSNGNVGIGTTSPTSPLSINNSSWGANLADYSGNSSGLYKLTLRNFNPEGGVVGYAFGVLNNGTNYANNLVLDRNRVGIGDQYPASKLSVLGNVSIGADYFYISSPTNGMIIQGNVGIGTTSPANKLDVWGNTYIHVGGDRNLKIATPDGYLDIIAVNDAGSGYVPLKFYSSAYSLLGGNVSIPDGTLTVSGTGNATIAGNVGIGTTTPGYLVTLSGGAYADGSSWVNASDVNLKENFTNLDPQEILSKISSLSIQRWNFKSQDSIITHIGPTAQDFYDLFKVGNSSTSLSTIDPAGVALLGIKALDQKILALQGAINQASTATTSLLAVYSPSNFSGDSVGQAKILAGSTSVRVTFTQAYQYQPVVTVTPKDFVEGSYRVTNVDASGFVIELRQNQAQDVSFNWHSFASPEAKLTVSDGSVENLVLMLPIITDPVPESVINPVSEILPTDTVNTDATTTSVSSQEVLGTSTPSSAIDIIPETNLEATPTPAPQEPLSVLTEPTP